MIQSAIGPIALRAPTEIEATGLRRFWHALPLTRRQSFTRLTTGFCRILRASMSVCATSSAD